jgi:hypothetical protein
MPRAKRSSSVEDDLNSPRIRFNSGYHDGYWEAKAGRARQMVEHGHADIRTVTLDFHGREYYTAYGMGADAFREGTYTGRSDVAWETYQLGIKAAKERTQVLQQAPWPSDKRF